MLDTCAFVLKVGVGHTEQTTAMSISAAFSPKTAKGQGHLYPVGHKVANKGAHHCRFSFPTVLPRRNLLVMRTTLPSRGLPGKQQFNVQLLQEVVPLEVFHYHAVCPT